MKKILTIFPFAENVHLTKDVGMVPYILHKHFGYDATLACYENGSYPNLPIDTPGLKMLFIRKITGLPTLDTAFFLLKNLNKFDVLVAFHYTFFAGINIFLFKLLSGFSKKKIAYLKLDTTEEIFVLKKRMFLSYLINFADVRSTEITSIYNTLHKEFKNLIYIPNGFYPKEDKQNITKENIFLTVGRIGSVQKASDILLQSFAKIADLVPDWKLVIIGPIETEFKSYIKLFFDQNLQLKDRILFEGPIYDRKLLMSKYVQSKIFILPSRWESFGIVFLEAGIAGCTIISSNILPADDVTDNGKYGKVFPIDDVSALASVMLELANDSVYLEDNSNAIKKFYEDNFYWPTILKRLDEKFQTLFKS